MLDLGFRPRACLVFLPLHRGSQHGSPAFRKKKLLRSGSSKVRSVQGDISKEVRLKGFDFWGFLFDLRFRPNRFGNLKIDSLRGPLHRGSQHGSPAFRKKKLLKSGGKVRSELNTTRYTY